ncbi:hypothetical protein ACQ4LE_004432 [Meloidogyne hapla]
MQKLFNLFILFSTIFIVVAGHRDLPKRTYRTKDNCLCVCEPKDNGPKKPNPPKQPTNPNPPSFPIKPNPPKKPSNPKPPNPIKPIHPINDGNTKVVKSKYTEKDSCLSESKASGPIKSNLNKTINGKFTFYGTGGRGACGYEMDEPKFSAAASGTLFNSGGQWVASCFPDKRYVLNDPICMSKCVKITYKCVDCSVAKTLIVPINNKCPECGIDHVDLSIDAFNYLEPKGGIVGIAKDATITYINC